MGAHLEPVSCASTTATPMLQVMHLEGLLQPRVYAKSFHVLDAILTLRPPYMQVRSLEGLLRGSQREVAKLKEDTEAMRQVNGGSHPPICKCTAMKRWRFILLGDTVLRCIASVCMATLALVGPTCLAPPALVGPTCLAPTALFKSSFEQPIPMLGAL